jgi:hypothetical protein
MEQDYEGNGRAKMKGMKRRQGANGKRKKKGMRRGEK